MKKRYFYCDVCGKKSVKSESLPDNWLQKFVIEMWYYCSEDCKKEHEVRFEKAKSNPVKPPRGFNFKYKKYELKKTG